MATRRLLTDLVTAYRAASPDDAITVDSLGGVEAAKRVAAGEPCDVVVLASGALEKLTAQGHVQAGSRVDLVHSPVALAIKAGAPHPAIGSEDEVKEAVSRARSIGYSTGPSGDHLLALLDRWGARAAVQERIVQAPPGVPVASLVARGDVEIGFQQLSEFMNADGIDILGLLPSSIQNVTIFAGGIARASAAEGRARQLLAFMASPELDALKRQHGMEPA
jgi:molybdate transport system substrate-binding protein